MSNSSFNRIIVRLFNKIQTIVRFINRLLGFFAYKIKIMGFKENLKSELAYSGMLVKELAAKSGVNKYSLDNYLNARGQLPSVEAGQKIAQALGVSVEYLVTGQESKKAGKMQKSNNDVRIIAKLAEQLDGRKRKFIIDFIKWLKKADYVMLIL